jgi:hypothetical protein
MYSQLVERRGNGGREEAVQSCSKVSSRRSAPEGHPQTAQLWRAAEILLEKIAGEKGGRYDQKRVPGRLP